MLHELVRYAEQSGLTSERGFKAKSIRWLLQFDAKGRFTGAHDCTGGNRKSKGRLFTTCPDLGVLTQGGGVAHFLADSLATVAMLVEKDEAKFKVKNAYFVNLLRQVALELPEYSAIAQSLQDPATLSAIQGQLVKQKAKPNDSATLAIVDVTTGTVKALLEDDDVLAWWRAAFAKISAVNPSKSKQAAKSTTSMLCFLSGVLGEPAKTHTKIDGLSNVGGRTVGDSLVSFDKDAFNSYGLKKGRNSAMLSQRVAVYTGALNHLLRSPQRTKRLAGVKIAYWYAGTNNDAASDVLADVIGPDGIVNNDDDDVATPASPVQIAQAETRAGKLLTAIANGERKDLADARFYALTLSANVGRVVIRDWMEGSFVSLAIAVNQWFSDLTIRKLSSEAITNPPSFHRVLTSPLRQRKPTENYMNWLAPVVAQRQALWLAATTGGELPRSLIASVLRRHASDVSSLVFAKALNDPEFKDTYSGFFVGQLYTRMGLLKAYLNRKYQGLQKESKMDAPQTVEAYLNESHPRAAYHCGRLMAVLQMIQRAAMGEVGTGIAQAFYAAAASRPVTAIPQLKTKTQHHLKKIEPKELREEYQRMLSQIDGRIGDCIPRTFDLEDQCFFHLGYYQQLPYQPYVKPAKRHIPMNGEPVRSLSEVIVANILESMLVPLKRTYKYEMPLDLKSPQGGTVTIRPDFTVPREGMPPLYIEHLGMMDNFTYREDWKKRKLLYAFNGILPAGENGPNGTLVMTKPDERTIDCKALYKQLSACI